MESLFFLRFQQGKGDMPGAKMVVDLISKFFQDAFGVKEAEIKLVENCTAYECKKAYTELEQELTDGKKTLVIHVVAGHGLEVQGRGELILNEHDEDQKFYNSFQAEKIIRELAGKH